MVAEVNLLVQAAGLAQQLERIVDARMRRPVVLQDGRNPPQGYVGGFAPVPVIQRRLQLVAVRAAVPEKINDLDAVASLDRLRGDQAIVYILSRANFLRLCVSNEARDSQ